MIGIDLAISWSHIETSHCMHWCIFSLLDVVAKIEGKKRIKNKTLETPYSFPSMWILNCDMQVNVTSGGGRSVIPISFQIPESRWENEEPRRMYLWEVMFDPKGGSGFLAWSCRQTGSVPAVAWRLPRLNSICKWKSWGLEPKVMTSFKSVASLCAHSHYRWPRHLAALLPFSGVSPPLSIKACKYKMLVSCLRTVPNSLQFTMIPNGNNKYRNFHGMEWNSNLKKKSRLRILNSIFLSLFQ